MARRGGEGSSPINAIAMAFIGLLMIVAIVTLGPVLGGQLEEATPALDPASPWNSTYNTDVPSGSTMWTTDVALGGVAVLVFFIALAISYLRYIGYF